MIYYHKKRGDPMRKSTDAQMRATVKYQKANVKMINLHLNVKTDADILAYLETLDNKTGYIKELIRKDMKNPD